MRDPRTFACWVGFILLPMVAGCGTTTEPGGPPLSESRQQSTSGDQSTEATENSGGIGKMPTVTVLQAPNGGIQPQAVIDDRGTIHLIYFRGDAGAGDLFYVRKNPAEKSFSRPIRVNSTPGSVVAIGNVRGAHLALGKERRLHVAWMGSRKTRSEATGNESPMLCTRLSDRGGSFEPQRNVIQKAYGLDGGGSVAADEQGNVYVVWHAPGPGQEGEQNRRVWVAHSKDDGKTFAPEQPASDQQTGACGCCGMRAWSDSVGSLYVLYRSATKQINRDVYLLRSPRLARPVEGIRLHKWKIASCPMSTMSFGGNQKQVLAAWETQGQVWFTRIDPKTGKPSRPIAAPGTGKTRKHPVVATNHRGNVLLAWTEGMQWKRGGALAWQVFDKSGRPTSEKGRAPGVPPWSLITAVTLKTGEFVIVR